MVTRYSLADLKVVQQELLRRAREETKAREEAARQAAEHARRAEEARQAAAKVAGDVALFRQVLAGVTPLPASNRVRLGRSVLQPVPRQRLADERRVLKELLRPVSDWEPDTETGESLTFLRHGLPRDILRKLRRGHWVVQSAIDLHGMDREEARLALSEFLGVALQKGHRCVRVIHGKGLGSHNREPVLKHKVKRFLQQRDEVLAFVEARNVDGGGGVTLVLLKGSR